MARTLLNIAGQKISNLLINGNMDFAQRLGGVITTAASGYGVDRWSIATDVGGALAFTHGRATDVPTLAQSGFQSIYSLKYTTVTGGTVTGTQRLSVTYHMEGHDYQAIHGKPFRVQFWVKASIAGNYSITFQNNDATRTYASFLTINSPNVWEKKAYDLTGDTAGTWLFDVGRGLSVRVTLANGAANLTPTLNQWQTTSGIFGAAGASNALVTTSGASMNFAQVGIIPGSFGSGTDISFVRAGISYEDELSMCQRYYEKSYGLEVTPGTINTLAGKFWFTGFGSLARPTFSVVFAARKRVPPTMTARSPITGTGGQYRNENLNADAGFSINSDPGEGSFYGQPVDTPSSGAACSVHWVAEAEL